MGILTAELLDTLLPKCRADDSLLAEIITKKLADHLPIYRIAESMQREEIKISRKFFEAESGLHENSVSCFQINASPAKGFNRNLVNMGLFPAYSHQRN